MPTNIQLSQEYKGSGRVLRVKEGFNPNSSSLGSIVFSIHTALIAAPVLLAGTAAWIASRIANSHSATKENAVHQATDSKS